MRIPQPALALALLALASLAQAGDIKPYSPKEFDQLTAAGKPVVIDVSAPWCPTCRAQKPVVEGLMKQPAYKDVTVLTVDFDSEKPVLQKFKVASQSTLVAFKGSHEVGRSVADISQKGLDDLIRKTVQ